MSETVTSLSETESRPRLPGNHDDRAGFGWGRLQLLAAIGALASFLVPMLIQLSFEPFLLSMAAPFVVGLLVMLRWPRVGVIWLGVVSLAELLFSAPFLAETLTHPESIADFIPLLVFTVSTLVATIAAIPALRQLRAPATSLGGARATAILAGVVIVAGAVVSVFAAARIEGVPAREGDIRVITEDIEFRPAAIRAEGTTIAVHVTNRDSTRHTFTIDELGVDLNLPPNSTQRVTFKAAPGTYRFFCRPHESDMQGDLVVR